MIAHRIRATDTLDCDFEAIREELGIPGDMPRPVLEAAETAARSPRLPTSDATDIPMVTVDPSGSLDLDQALGISTDGDGWKVHYAITDVAAWVDPHGPVDVEARTRTQTYYAPDRRVPLHPPVLGEMAASLMPDGPRPAALWTIRVAADGTTTAVDVRRAMVRSRARLSYPEVQAALDGGRELPEPIAQLPALGAALLADARRRGAIDLGLPEQEVTRSGDGSWTITIDRDLPVEVWNAQVSLLTGRAAASMMIEAGVGVLRTVPTPEPSAVDRLRVAAGSLGIAWPDGASPGTVLADLDRSDVRSLAFADLAAELLRGASYHDFSGTVPTEHGHAGVGAPYAHVTAPLRRLVDRFGTEICLAIAEGQTVPAWVTEALPSLPRLMAEGDSRAKKLDRAALDVTEAFVLTGRVGERFTAHVVETGPKYGTVVVDDPPVRARCDTPDLPLGTNVKVRLATADVETRTVRFELVR